MLFTYLKHLVITATSWALSSSEDEILVGGQAVIEGVMMRSPKGYSVAVRRQDGTVRVMKDPLLAMGEKWKLFKTPIVRGVGVQDDLGRWRDTGTDKQVQQEVVDYLDPLQLGGAANQQDLRLALALAPARVGVLEARHGRATG